MSKVNITSKNNNGWILCPSKSFAGKFYYFNVVTGDAAWSMNEVEKKNTKKFNEIHKLADRSHCYPEPDTPPIECPEITTTNIGQHSKLPRVANITNPPYVQQLPIFGQAAFPRYVPNIESCIPSIVWMPIRYPNPVCASETKPSMTDQVTQTSDANILVHTCGPCCKRFVNYEKPIISFSENKLFNSDIYNHFVNSIENNEASVTNVRIDPTDNFNFQTSTPNKKAFQIQTGVPNFRIRNPVFNFETDPKVDNGYSTLAPGNKVENCNSRNVKLLLGENDLRHRLMSSARKKNMAVDPADDHTTMINTNGYETKKKKVSFDLSDLSDENTCSGTNNYTKNMPDTCIVNFTDTQVPKTTDCPRSVWYIVVDPDVWLDNHELIETIVLSDKNCKLLIPYAVRIDIEAMSQGECRGQQRVFTARQLARRCATPPQHYVVEPAYSNDVRNLFTTDGILECCIRAINDNHQVIIISNEPQLHAKAKAINIPCYKVDDVRGTDTRTQVELDLKNIKITVPCDDTCNDTVIISASDTPAVAVDSYRTQLLKKNNSLIDISDSKKKSNPTVNYEIDTTTNGIKDLENVNRKDKSHMSNIKRTVLNLNCVPISNGSIEDFEKIAKTIPNSNVAEEFRDRITVSKSICENSVFQFQKSAPNSNNTGAFLFQNAVKKYASTQSHDLKKPNSNTRELLTSNNIQIDNIKTTKQPETEKPHNTEPIVSFPFKNNSNFKFNQSHLKAPPSFYFQNQTKDSPDSMPALDEQIKYIDSELKKYCVKSKLVDGNIQRRMEEWFCCYVQIMEDILSYILQLSVVKKKLTPPWTLKEAASNLQMVYEDNAVMTYLVTKYLDFFGKATSEKGKLNPFMKSNDFMKIIGCGSLLIQQLKNIYPDNQHLVEAEKKLNLLLETIKCPIEVNTDEFDTLKPPVVYRSEIEDEQVSRSNFIKEPSYVIDYLRRHYKEWKTYIFVEKELTPKNLPDTKILRTFGKNLNMLTIDNNKSMTLNKITRDNSDNDGPKTIRSLNNKHPVERSAAKSMTKTTKEDDIVYDESNIKRSQHKECVKRNVTNKAEPKTVKIHQTNRPITRSSALNTDKFPNECRNAEKAAPKSVKILQNNQPKTRSNALSTDKFTNETRNAENVIPKSLKSLDQDNLDTKQFDPRSQRVDKRNEITQEAELKLTSISRQDNATKKTKSRENLKNRRPLDLDRLDYSEGNESYISLSYEDIFSESCISHEANHLVIDEKNTKYILSDINISEYSDVIQCKDITRNGSCTNDSGFENDSTYAHTVVKILFTELSDSFKVLHKFITECIKEINHDTSEERKKELHENAASSLEHVGVMIQQMKSIISRELDDTGPLRTLLIGAGIEASADKRISRYRQFVTKCLEQARVLHNALKIIISLTGDADCASISSESTSHRYFNIFDITS